ncbi:uncharacterized protein CANTADRAFT_27536 [Suhomyces tanzawaensis NRRL Y-17324]|uniref:Uncharacterized protein n=1 Tax=Suhomyces tanzawaensis NRRL Y-17324 TaxID=984487 RepID=A0A1E4SB59_9ASCO|nr:uncharacterized protein CANTADRAFT_27536 [Suhomyces tanzawaensis NRRL Y-17324]ODV76760.1 hypothetical protein CANTADRAFT_27536 [Suhomyces tanzawaensis NRRL Y-17324]
MAALREAKSRNAKITGFWHDHLPLNQLHSIVESRVNAIVTSRSSPFAVLLKGDGKPFSACVEFTIRKSTAP